MLQPFRPASIFRVTAQAYGVPHPLRGYPAGAAGLREQPNTHPAPYLRGQLR